MLTTGLQLLLARYRDTEAEARADQPVAGADGGGRCAAGRPADHVGGLSRAHALAVHPQHLGRGLARQHRALHPRHRPGVVHPHGRAAQRRDTPGAVLPVGVPRPDRGVLSAHRCGAHHRLHPEFGGGVGLAVPGQRGDAHLESAQVRAPTQWRTAGAAATAAALSASFTSVPYVEFGVAAMPNLAAYGVAVPTFVLITSTLRHRDRIPVAVLALVGVLSVHLTGGFIVILFLVAWWLLDACWHPVRGRLADVLTLAAVAVPTALILAPQFIGVLQAGRHHRRARVPQLQERQAGRRSTRCCCTPATSTTSRPSTAFVLVVHRHGDPAVQENLVAAGGVAGADRGDHLREGAVSRPARRRHREVQRVLLQRSAPAHVRGDDAGDADGGHRVVRDRLGGGGTCQAVLDRSDRSSRCPRRSGSRPRRSCCWEPPCSPAGITCTGTSFCSATNTTR